VSKDVQLPEGERPGIEADAVFGGEGVCGIDFVSLCSNKVLAWFFGGEVDCVELLPVWVTIDVLGPWCVASSSCGNDVHAGGEDAFSTGTVVGDLTSDFDEMRAEWDTIWSKGTGIVCAACLLSMLRGSERCPVHVAC
jgi:hypothetical protein